MLKERKMLWVLAVLVIGIACLLWIKPQEPFAECVPAGSTCDFSTNVTVAGWGSACVAETYHPRRCCGDATWGGQPYECNVSCRQMELVTIVCNTAGIAEFQLTASPGCKCPGECVIATPY